MKAAEDTQGGAGIHSEPMRSWRRFAATVQGVVGEVARFKVRDPFDFRAVESAEAAAVRDVFLGPADRPLKSFNVIGLENDPKLCEILVDIGQSDVWKRFAIAKEASHAILKSVAEAEHWGREDDGLDPYPATIGDGEILELFRSLGAEPFSLGDFDGEFYNPKVKIENAAEALAFLLLVPWSEVRKERILWEASGEKIHDFSVFAEKHRIPQHYAEVFVVNPAAPKLDAMLEEAMRAAGLDIDGRRIGTGHAEFVPDPRPGTGPVKFVADPRPGTGPETKPKSGPGVGGAKGPGGRRP
ncbi:hypothetical protein GCM10007904_39560 [Oharaeibacter diazotrophicus]|nr:hypothetical protein GCM10007904_39560 [Oharaeibacter diazotrophicus]